jgi:DNA-binding HxlR family transcriptional regulator
VKDAEYCPRFHHAIEVLGRRWTGVILLAMHHGASRYCEIREAIPGLSDRLLSERLRELEAEGIVNREVLPEMPPAVRYSLSRKGRGLGPVFAALATWSQQYVERK